MSPSSRCLRVVLRVAVLSFWLRGSLALAAADSAPADSQAKPDPRAEGTRHMARVLEGVARRLSVEGNPYDNAARAKRLAIEEKSAAPDEVVDIRHRKAEALLNSGRTEAAIAEYEALRGLLKTDTADARHFAKRFREHLAMAYLRLGEQENCLADHSVDSCLFPIRGGGVHRFDRGSRAAIREYTALLTEFPEDLDSRWLLNVAAMTVNEYPEGVPEAWRIPPAAFASDYPLPRFVDVASDVGVAIVGLSGGCALEDFDNDGDLDIMASAWGTREPLRLMRNDGDGTFSDWTAAAGLVGIVGGLNMVHADYNNDGHADVFILRGAWMASHGDHPNSLLRNNGDGTFADVTREAGVLSFRPTQTAAWGDFNNDGWLDLFVGNETTTHAANPCELFMSRGDGTFKDAARAAGVALRKYVKGVACGDFDNDGRLDIYVSCLRSPNYLFRNLGPGADGVPKFENVADRAGVQEPFHSFPTWFWDYDNDGWLDIFVSGYSIDRFGRIASDVAASYLGRPFPADTPRVYRNNGDGTFSDQTAAVGLRQAIYTMGCNFGDLDNDGFLDFYLGTGEPDLRGVVPNRMFRNDGGRRFQDVTTAGGFGHLQKGHAIAFGDLDNDGDQDVYAVMGGAFDGDVYPNALFHNPGSTNRWLTLVLRGTRSNRDAIGARIVATVTSPGGRRDVHVTVSTGGSFGSSSLRQEIGLGDATALERVTVRWPRDGVLQAVTNPPLDRALRIVEGQAGATALDWPVIGAGD